MKNKTNTYFPLKHIKFSDQEIVNWQNNLNFLPVRDEPWPHIEIENFLPKKIYENLISSLPEGKKSESSPSRSWVTLDTKSTKLLCFTEEDESWWGKKMLHSIRPLLIMFGNHSTFNNLRGSFKKSLNDRMSVNDDEKILVMIRVNHDRDDYHLGVHLDLPDKFLSLLIYLPLDTSNEAGGTSLYKPKSNFQSKTIDGKLIYEYLDENKFEFVKKTKFIQNSALIFPATIDSFHGKPQKLEDFRQDRFTLQVNYYKYTKKGIVHNF
jgi:hypothetical protein